MHIEPGRRGWRRGFTCTDCPNNHATLSIPPGAVAHYLVRNDAQVLDGPRSETLGRVVFNNSDGLALRLVKAYFRKDAQ